MKRFKDINNIATFMLDHYDHTNDPISIVANKDIIVKVMTKLLARDDVELIMCDINDFDYDMEYILSLCKDDPETYNIFVEQSYYSEKDVYLASDGYVLFHEDVPSKAQLDMEHALGDEIVTDWFVLGDDDCVDEECEGKLDTNHSESGDGTQIGFQKIWNKVFLFAE